MSEYAILPWDTAFFGFPVARIEADVRSQAGVASALDALRRHGVRLCYWMPEIGTDNARIARELNGVNVGAHARYERELAGMTAVLLRSDIQIAPHASADAAPELVRLARSAGRLSRFSADQRMPAGTADRMFDIWIRRSIAREIADAVLVARRASSEPVGLVTVAREQDRGSVGLIAVDQGQQRSGIGRALMQAAAAHLVGQGARSLRVTTQRENSAACALYEACGFALVRLELTIHFWL